MIRYPVRGREQSWQSYRQKQGGRGTTAKLYETPGGTYVCNYDVTNSKYISGKYLKGRVSTGNYAL